MMDMTPHPFTPPAPVPRARASIPSLLEIVRTLMRNPLEMWGAPSYEDKVIHHDPAVNIDEILANTNSHWRTTSKVKDKESQP